MKSAFSLCLVMENFSFESQETRTHTFTVMLAISPVLLDNFTMEGSPWFKKIHHLWGKSRHKSSSIEQQS